mgnify:CR=1 FL=1
MEQDFPEIFDRIETGLKIDFEGKQLACISKLVFFCGIRAKEIPALKIGDVIGKDDQIVREIKIKDAKSIHLNGAAFEAMQGYIADLRQRNSAFMQAGKPPFPSYRNVDKLKRDWRRFGLNYRTIKEAAYVHFLANERQKGTPDARIYKKGTRQLRVTARQFRAVATFNKIGPGEPVDNRMAREIMMLLEQAENLNKDVVDAEKTARDIMEGYEERLKRIRSDEVRERYEGFRSRFEKLLGFYLK